MQNIQSGWKLVKNDQELWNIVNWLKKYIDISHSRRHTNSQKVLKRGNWQGPNNFFKDYREIDKSTTSEANTNNKNMNFFVPL
ncbi:unnamed protein product [Parnassius mnemosyne]|uniref:Uncharacterized protein n=1 Tax=Parnassius mnemosyne TaxID=213953 RepID=A0AAV1L0C7_9NEOP